MSIHTRMKQKIFLFTFTLCILYLGPVVAQDTIVDALESSTSASEGIIKIESDPAITALLGKPNAKKEGNMSSFDATQTSGFRILVFMGNHPKNSRAEAFKKESLVKSVFVDMSTYVNYEAPNWKLVVGDFMTQEEATLFKEILQSEFPQLKREMYIVADKINIPTEKIDE